MIKLNYNIEIAQIMTNVVNSLLSPYPAICTANNQLSNSQSLEG